MVVAKSKAEKWATSLLSHYKVVVPPHLRNCSLVLSGKVEVKTVLAFSDGVTEPNSPKSNKEK
jgi:hypothetical protein